MGQAEASADALLSGVRMTYDQFIAELRKSGLCSSPRQAGMFDRPWHEAIASVPSSGKPRGEPSSPRREGVPSPRRLLRPPR